MPARPRRPCAATPHRRAARQWKGCRCWYQKAKRVHGPRVHGRAALLARGRGRNAQRAIIGGCGDGAGRQGSAGAGRLLFHGARAEIPRLSLVCGIFCLGFCPLAPWALLRNGGLLGHSPARVRAWWGLWGWPWGCAGRCPPVHAACRCAALPPEVEAALARAKLPRESLSVLVADAQGGARTPPGWRTGRRCPSIRLR